MSNLMLLGVGVVAVVGIVFLADLWLESFAVNRAIRKTTNRAVGLVTGALASFMLVLTIGTEAVLSAPELLITLLGVGAIIAGISWEVFAATAFVTWVVGRTVERGRA